VPPAFIELAANVTAEVWADVGDGAVASRRATACARTSIATARLICKVY
jgi:hypothetical protein